MTARGGISPSRAASCGLASGRMTRRSISSFSLTIPPSWPHVSARDHAATQLLQYPHVGGPDRLQLLVKDHVAADRVPAVLQGNRADTTGTHLGARHRRGRTARAGYGSRHAPRPGEPIRGT